MIDTTFPPIHNIYYFCRERRYSILYFNSFKVRLEPAVRFPYVVGTTAGSKPI